MKTVVTGYRPTGRLHIGHYFGNLKKMVELQEKYKCYFFIVEWHALTTSYDEASQMRSYVHEMILDWLAAGLDPNKAVLYKQSDVPELAELGIYLAMITPVSWLERNPTYKEMIRELKGKEIATLGFLGYPVWQCADIIIVHGEHVPVGEDQLPHIELSREIVRRFNSLYGKYFKEPQALLSEAPRIPGTDGRKMSKSFNNTIDLSDSEEVVREKLKTMVTDPARKRITDKGTPEKCPVYELHKVFDPENLDMVAGNCRTAGWGCIQCKSLVADRVVELLSEFQKRRAELEKDKGLAELVLKEGGEKARKVAGQTLDEVRKRMGI